MIIPSVIGQTKHLPESGYYLALADYFIDETKNWKETKSKELRVLTLEKIMEAFNWSTSLFKEDKKNYNPKQLQWFLERKILVCKKWEKLQRLNLKMILDDAEKNIFFNIKD